MTNNNQYPQIIHTETQSIIKITSHPAVLCEKNPLFTVYTDKDGTTCGLSIKYEDTNERNIMQLTQGINITCNMGHTGIGIQSNTPSNQTEEITVYNTAQKIDGE